MIMATARVLQNLPLHILCGVSLDLEEIPFGFRRRDVIQTAVNEV